MSHCLNLCWFSSVELTNESHLTHWATQDTIGSDNGLSPVWHQAIICTNVGILSIGPLETNFSEMLRSKIQIFSFKKMHLKMSSGKWWPFYLSLNLLRPILQEVFKILLNKMTLENALVKLLPHISEVSESNNIGSVNGPVPSNNKPLTDAILLAHSCDAI